MRKSSPVVVGLLTVGIGLLWPPLGWTELTQTEKAYLCYATCDALQDICIEETETDPTTCRQEGFSCVHGCLISYPTVPVDAIEDEFGNNTGASISRGVVDCPPGTVRTTLGNCVEAPVRETENAAPTRPCDPGPTDGPDGCLPRVVFTSSGDDWGYVRCPPGMEPGPVDGCVLDLDLTDSSDDRILLSGKWPTCPPGQNPTPDDGGCVPADTAQKWGNLRGVTWVREALRAVSPEAPTRRMPSVTTVEPTGPEVVTTVHELEVRPRPGRETPVEPPDDPVPPQ